MITQNKKVSVCITTYNRPKLLKESLKSVIFQSYKNLEIIICDNSESDESKGVVESFFDSRIKYIKNETNIGLSKNMIKSISLASGEFITWLGDDDLMDHKNIELKINLFEKHPFLNIVASAVHYVERNGKTILHTGLVGDENSMLDGTRLIPYFSGQEGASFVTMLFRSEKYQKLIQESYHYYYEYMLLYVAGASEKKIGFINKYLHTLINTDHYRTFQKGDKVFDDVRKDFDTLKLWLVDQYRNAMHLYPEVEPVLNVKKAQLGILRELIKRHKWSGRFFSFNEYCFTYGNLPLLNNFGIIAQVLMYNARVLMNKIKNRVLWAIELLTFRKIRVS